MSQHQKKHRTQKQNEQGRNKNKGARLTGIMSITRKGIGYVKVLGQEIDIEVQKEYLNTALHLDTVEVAILPRHSRDTRARGEVTKIVERAKTEFVGITHKENDLFYVKPSDGKTYTSFRLLEEDRKRVGAGIKVVIQMNEWADPREMPSASLVEILGPAGVHETEMRAIIREKGFSRLFPPDVESEARSIHNNKEKLFIEGTPKRKDFRGTPTFTIDPFDAKDFDDAVSVKKLEGGKYEIGIHIADVSHFVIKGDAIDKEALERGTSIYLVDRTIPMLPEVLSNDVCSLNPNEDKFTFSAVFVMSLDGAVHEEWFGETIINSDKRFTYQDAQTVLDTGSGTLSEELIIIQKISGALRARRFEAGAINFDSDEVQFKLDENGKPLSVYRKTRTETMLIIEDLMLLANKHVAEWMSRKLARLPSEQNIFVYRIHDLPKEERIDKLSIFLKALGHQISIEHGSLEAKDVNAMLKEIEGTPEEDMIKTATIRTMAKAVYSLKNIGHFGLAFPFYTHFTSPIRRYPDLMVHRLVKAQLKNEPTPKEKYAQYDSDALHSSEREVAAVEAERESIRMKQVEFLSEKIGHTFDGVISGVSEWGVYVEEQTTMADGMVRVRDMKDDFYTLSDTGFELVGENTGKRYRLGEKVRVKLMATDVEERTIDWQFV